MEVVPEALNISTQLKNFFVYDYDTETKYQTLQESHLALSSAVKPANDPSNKVIVPTSKRSWTLTDAVAPKQGYANSSVKSNTNGRSATNFGIRHPQTEVQSAHQRPVRRVLTRLSVRKTGNDEATNAAAAAAGQANEQTANSNRRALDEQNPGLTGDDAHRIKILSQTQYCLKNGHRRTWRRQQLQLRAAKHPLQQRQAPLPSYSIQLSNSNSSSSNNNTAAAAAVTSSAAAIIPPIWDSTHNNNNSNNKQQQQQQQHQQQQYCAQLGFSGGGGGGSNSGGGGSSQGMLPDQENSSSTTTTSNTLAPTAAAAAAAAAAGVTAGHHHPLINFCGLGID
ncbi:unnamed protein product [Ceratitis capitata]|uniref:(Mediterranean fruit fly) hypothetical protein n=1 Tax=Ceratitis capitata TaxID=7213 RepID=A0A811V415_CERCA|nr:unnamed protein product [Ceratitis capitata]